MDSFILIAIGGNNSETTAVKSDDLPGFETPFTSAYPWRNIPQPPHMLWSVETAILCGLVCFFVTFIMTFVKLLTYSCLTKNTNCILRINAFRSASDETGLDVANETDERGTVEPITQPLGSQREQRARSSESMTTTVGGSRVSTVVTSRRHTRAQYSHVVDINHYFEWYLSDVPTMLFIYPTLFISAMCILHTTDILQQSFVHSSVSTYTLVLISASLGILIHRLIVSIATHHHRQCRVILFLIIGIIVNIVILITIEDWILGILGCISQVTVPFQTLKSIILLKYQQNMNMDRNSRNAGLSWRHIASITNIVLYGIFTLAVPMVYLLYAMQFQSVTDMKIESLVLFVFSLSFFGLYHLMAIIKLTASGFLEFTNHPDSRRVWSHVCPPVTRVRPQITIANQQTTSRGHHYERSHSLSLSNTSELFAASNILNNGNSESSVLLNISSCHQSGDYGYKGSSQNYGGIS